MSFEKTLGDYELSQQSWDDLLYYLSSVSFRYLFELKPEIVGRALRINTQVKELDDPRGRRQRLVSELKLISPAQVEYIDYYIYIKDPKGFFKQLENSVRAGKDVTKGICTKLFGNECKIDVRGEDVIVSVEDRLTDQGAIILEGKSSQTDVSYSKIYITVLDNSICIKRDQSCHIDSMREMVAVVFGGLLREEDFDFVDYMSLDEDDMEIKSERKDIAYLDKKTLLSRFPEAAAALRTYSVGHGK